VPYFRSLFCLTITNVARFLVSTWGRNPLSRKEYTLVSFHETSHCSCIMKLTIITMILGLALLAGIGAEIHSDRYFAFPRATLYAESGSATVTAELSRNWFFAVFSGIGIRTEGGGVYRR
jgi:hypothetical protein